MVFNKSKGWSLFGHSSTQHKTEEPPVAISTKQPEATDLEPENDVIAPEAAAPEPAVSRAAAEPSHDLYKAVNKFKQLLRQAPYASDGGEWVEKCMHELATGLEIAIDCDLVAMRDALIDTARILHSYDRAGRWQDSLPFLNNSYNILSLMVGDLIVDKIQPALIRKWNSFYQKATEELVKAGITLADDEEDPAALEEASAADFVAEENLYAETNLDTPEEQSPGEDEENSPEPQAEELRSPEVSQEVPEAHDSADEALEIPPLSDPDPDDIVQEESLVSDSIIKFPNSSSATTFRPKTDQHTDDIFDDQAEEETGSTEELETDDAYQETGSTEELEADDVYQDDLMEDEDFLFDDMTAGVDDEETESTEMEEEALDSAIEEVEANLTEESEPVGDDAMEEDDDVAEETELAKAIPQPASEVEFIDDSSETESLFEEEELTTAPIDTPPVQPAASEHPVEPDDPARLLQRAREAMDKGAVQDAKSAALELALSMARIEYEQALNAVAQAEQRLVDNAQAIRAAQDAVESAEQSLLQTEEVLATREGECDACREHITALDDELEQFQTDLQEIEAQIEALQQKRAEQVNRIENKHIEKEDVLHNESRLQTEIESLKQEADGMRQDLDNLRVDKKNKIDNKRTIEVDICVARETAEGRQTTFDAIKRTLNPEAESTPESYPENDGLL